jgi:hypothetical protein
MMQLPNEVGGNINHNHRYARLPGYEASGYGANSVYQHGNSHRRTSSQTNVADLGAPPSNPIPIVLKPQEKDRKTSKTQGIFRLPRRRPKDTEGKQND